MSPLNSLKSALSRLAPVATGAIGLDLATDRLNLVQFRGEAGSPVVRAAASLLQTMPRAQLLADPVALKALLREAFDRHGFTGRRVVSCVHASELRIFPVTASVAAGQDEAAVLAADLRARLGAEIDSAVVDYLPIRSDDAEPTRRDALVAVAPRARVMAYLEALERAGLEVCALDIGPAALARLIAHVNQADARTQYPNTLAINFGRNRSHLSVIWGQRLILDREIEFAECALLSRVTRALGVDDDMAQRLLLDKGLHADPGRSGEDAEIARTLTEVLRPEFAALVAEVNKTLIYTASRSRGRGVDQIYLLGSAGRYPGVGRLMQELLAIPVEVLNPFRTFRSPMLAADLDQLKPIAGIALACGLGLRGLRADA